jgi:putative ABC transport system substrate-binding protein
MGPRNANERREFLAWLGGAAILWPLTALAQQQQMRRVGVLVGLAPNADEPIAQAFLRPFRDAMREAGWVEGVNIHIDYRFGGALTDLSKTKASAAELVALRPEVIYAQGLPATLAVRQLTSTIPIVFTQLIDPVGFGLAEGLGNPGGNVTGFITWDFAIGGKWMQLFARAYARSCSGYVLFNPDNAPTLQGDRPGVNEAAQGVHQASSVER